MFARRPGDRLPIQLEFRISIGKAAVHIARYSPSLVIRWVGTHTFLNVSAMTMLETMEATKRKAVIIMDNFENLYVETSVRERYS